MQEFKIGLSGCSGALESISSAALLDLAELTEELGYDALWLNEEHFQGGEGGGADGRRCLSPLILASAILARTSRLRVGFSVLLLAMYHPLRLAEEIASLDVLSNGRVDLGISRGANPRYLSVFGIDDGAGSQESFTSGMDLMQRAWLRGPLRVGSESVSIEPKPIQQPHPPVFVGTYTSGTAAWAARNGHRIICHGINNLEAIRPVLQAYATEGGNLAEVPFGRFVYVSESDEQAREELWETVLKLTDRLKTIGISRRGNIISDDDLEPEAFYNRMVIAGSPKTCAQRILELRQEFGIGYLNALAAFFGFLPLDALKRSLTLLAKEVRPLLR